MENQDLNNLFCRQVKAVKRTEDIGVIAPQYIRFPKYEECFAMAFLHYLSLSSENYQEYADIEFHDIQEISSSSVAHSMDLYCREHSLGVEVVSAVNSEYREEEAAWNKPLCKGKSDTLMHEWTFQSSQPTSLDIIKKAIESKEGKYQSYKKAYSPTDIDLFVFAVDALIQQYRSLYGIPVLAHYGVGFPAYEDLGLHGLQPMLQDMRPHYRRIYFVFWNYWYYAERDKNFKIQCCKFRENHRNAVCEGTRIIQEKKLKTEIPQKSWEKSLGRNEG